MSTILKNPEKSWKILKNSEGDGQLIENIKAIKIHDPGNMLKILKLRS